MEKQMFIEFTQQLVELNVTHILAKYRTGDVVCVKRRNSWSMLQVLENGNMFVHSMRCHPDNLGWVSCAIAWYDEKGTTVNQYIETLMGL